MKCFGEKSRCLHCKIVLLDDQELFHEVLEMTTGQDILEKVFHHLNLIETAYFGLRYLDASNQTHWLEPTKRIVKQMKGSTPYTLYFSVKFYAADPSKLAEEITRYQLFLQVKQDILQGRLPVPHELAAELGAYAVQSELGDFDPERHPPGYISEFRFVANQSTLLEEDIAAKHKHLLGMVPSDAEAKYLEKVMWLDMYGVDLHPVLGEDNIEYFLGLTPAGVIVLRNKAKVGNYFWPRITKVYFRGKFFMLRVRDKNNSEKTYGFETPSKSACKHLWRCCVEHHAFFRLTQSAATSPQALFSLHSNFSGRTEKEALIDAQSYSRPQPQFKRQPSRKFQRRIIETNISSSITECRTSSTTLNSLHPIGSGSATSLPAVSPYTNGTNINNHSLYRNVSETTLQSPNNHSATSVMVKNHKNSLNNNHEDKKEQNGSRNNRTISPNSIVSTNNGNNDDTNSNKSHNSHNSHHSHSCHGNCKMSRRASSADSQSSTDSRGHRRRRRRSRHRSSDCESEGSNSSKSRHRHHHHRSRHNSNDSCDRRKHRRSRHRNTSRSSVGSTGEAELQWGQLKPAENPGEALMVRDISKSGYLPSGHETESDFVNHHNRRRHRRHRSRSRSPSEAKHSHFPDELKPHINMKLQGTDGMTHAELKDIPYTKIETAKNIKIKYSTSSSKNKKHKNTKKDKSLNDIENQTPQNTDSPPPPYTSLEHQQMYKHRISPDDMKKEIPDVIQSNKASKTTISTKHLNGHDQQPIRRTEHARVITMIPPTTHTNYYHNERNHHDYSDRNGYHKDRYSSHYTIRDPVANVTTSIKPDQPSPQSSETSGISVGSSSVSMVSPSVVTSVVSYTPQHDSTPSTSLSLRSQQPFPSQSSEYMSDQPHSLPMPISSPALQNSISQSNILSSRGYMYSGSDLCDSNINFYSPSANSDNLKPTYSSVKKNQVTFENESDSQSMNSTIDRCESRNTLSKKYFSQNKNDSLTENIDLVNNDNSETHSNNKTNSLRPMPHPRSSRMSPSSDPDYANSHMVQTMKRMDHKQRNSPASICSSNTLGIPPSTPSDWSVHNDNSITCDSPSKDSNEMSPISQCSERPSPYFIAPRPRIALPTFQSSPRFNTLSESSYNSRCESLPYEYPTPRNQDNMNTPNQSYTWSRGKSAKTQAVPDFSASCNTLPSNSSGNVGAHWKVHNWDSGRSSKLSNFISSTDQLSQIGQRNVDFSSRGRQGSVGSLELILSPLIQSALQNQNR